MGHSPGYLPPPPSKSPKPIWGFSTGVDILISKTFCSQIFAAICKMISTEKILRAICILQIFGSARESAVASCNFLFLHLAFCIFLQIDAALICNLQNKNFAFCVFQRRFLLGSFNYGDKFQFRPKARNLQKVDFAFCILQLFAVLSTCQLARCKNKILHFAFCIFLQICNRAKIECKHRFFAV